MLSASFRWAAIGALIVMVTAIAAAQAIPDDGLTLYVATDGNDAWSGRLAEPAATGDDGPFATITRRRRPRWPGDRADPQRHLPHR